VRQRFDCYAKSLITLTVLYKKMGDWPIAVALWLAWTWMGKQVPGRH
jgi:hypothetical protein